MLIAMTTRAEMVVRAQGFTIGGVRILAGLMWLANLHWKVPTDFGEANGGGFYKYVAAGADNAPLAPYRWALRELVMPNFQLFGWFTLISEAVVAALLLIGYRSRLVALAGDSASPRFHDGDRVTDPKMLPNPTNPKDVATLFSYALPLASAPAGRIAFKVRRPDRPDDPIVDAG